MSDSETCLGMDRREARYMFRSTMRRSVVCKRRQTDVFNHLFTYTKQKVFNVTMSMQNGDSSKHH